VSSRIGRCRDSSQADCRFGGVLPRLTRDKKRPGNCQAVLR